MKTDLLTTVVIAIVGALGGFFITNLLMGDIQSVSVKTLEDGVTSELAEPDPEIFNYRALNPTVEVYVGDCDNYNEYGECTEDVSDPYVDNGQQLQQEDQEDE